MRISELPGIGTKYEIKGHKYIYEVGWDPEKKKQIWNYVGKERDSKGVDPEKLKDEIYKAIKKDYRIGGIIRVGL